MQVFRSRSSAAPASPVTTDPILAEHAAEIRRLGKRTLADVIEIGARLTECKRICGHNNWLPWLDREFGWEETTAQRFMRVHKLAQSKSGKLPDLPVSAIYMLAAPSTPEPAKTEIIERAKAGEALRATEVRRVVERHKPPASKPRKAKRAKAADPPPPPSNEMLQQRAAAAERIRALMGGKTRDNIGPASNDEITRKDARIEELQADKRRLEIENIGLRSEVEETKAVRKPEGEGEGSELGNLLRAWDRASQGAREKFKARVGLVAVEPPAKVMDDGLDIPECLRRAAP